MIAALASNLNSGAYVTRTRKVEGCQWSSPSCGRVAHRTPVYDLFNYLEASSDESRPGAPRRGGAAAAAPTRSAGTILPASELEGGLWALAAPGVRLSDSSDGGTIHYEATNVHCAPLS